VEYPCKNVLLFGHSANGVKPYPFIEKLASLVLRGAVSKTFKG
jgi:hypothetical protein